MGYVRARPMSSPLDAARALGPEIRAAAGRIEHDRRLPLDLVRALTDAGVFRMCVPRSCAGGEADPATMIRVLETIAEADGSAGWSAMIGATSGVAAAYLPIDAAREIYGERQDVVTGGVFAPWTVSGLRGTGSHDIAVDDVFVPASRSLSLITDRPRERGPLYAFPVFGLLALGIAGVALGIARRAIDELARVAAGKTPTGSRRVLAERSVVQAQVAEAEAGLGSARAFVFETVESAWQAAKAEGVLDVRRRALLRLSATHATLAASSAWARSCA